MSTKEFDRIPHLTSTSTGAFKYQRRVPKHAQAAIGKKMWDLSLGRNYGIAVDKARTYAATHDTLLSKLTTPDDQAKFKQAKFEELAAGVVRLLPGLQRRIGDDGQIEEVPPLDLNPGHWKQTPDKIKSASALPPKQELQNLAYFAAYAFSDRSTLDLLPDNDAIGDALVDVLQPRRPNDPIDAPMYDAMKTALDARIQKIGGAALVNPKHTLTHLHEIIAELRASKPSTVKFYKMTTTKFLKFLREEKGMDFEPSIGTITDQLLQEYLDYLLKDKGVANTSISKYFDGINSVFNHAIRTKRVPGLVVNPLQYIELPATRSVEDSMYLPFNRDEIRRIWEEAQINWGADNHKTQLSAERRRAFLICLRVMLWTTLRPVEVFWLRDHGEVTPEYIDVQRTKTGINRKIPLSDHIMDFYQFTQDGGFDACIYHGKQPGTYNAGKLKEVMRASFFDIRKQAKVTAPRKVLYSIKDTLLQRLRSVEGYNTYLEVCVTGHVKKLEKGRNSGGTLGDDEAVRAKVKKALDQITYW